MASARKPTGYVIYRGPSMLDGAPIVAIAITSSANVKTGNMVQTYIMREDVAPLAALKSGADASICGDCKHRPISGGACYVRVDQGPTVVYKALLRGNYPAAPTTLPEWSDFAQGLGAGRMVRLGTYGDPMAVPAYVWQALTARAAGVTGYSHQWRNAAIPEAQRAAIMRLCMASADDPREAEVASAQGLRYFRIRRADESLRPREFICPASQEAGMVRTCATCGACNGTRAQTASGEAKGGSPVIVVHGAKKGRYIAIRAA